MLSTKWIFAGAIIAGLIVRFFYLLTLPFTVDEIQLAFAVESVSVHFIPVHFYGFGWGENVTLAYLALPFIRLIPALDPVIVIRFMALMANAIFILFLYLLSKLLLGRDIARATAVLAIFSAWSIRASVVGYNAFLLPGLYTAALFFFLRGVQERRRKDYMLAGVLAAVSMYTYALSFLAVPLLVIIAVFAVRQKMNWRFLAESLLLATAMALPIVIFYLKNQFDIPIGDRFAFLSIPSLSSSHFDQASIFRLHDGFAVTRQYIFNYLMHFTFIGLAQVKDGLSLQYLGLITDVFFLPVGLYALSKSVFVLGNRLVLQSFFVLPLASSFVNGDFWVWSYTRDIALLPFVLIISAVGMMFVWNKLIQALRQA